MATRRLTASGLKNQMARHSAPHGPGRRLSRTKAKERLTLKDLQDAMRGIEFHAKPAFIDEIPGAYKDIDQVIENAKDLVRVDHTLKQIINVKGE